MPQMAMNGVTLAYEEFGPATGPALLLAHAFPLRGELWHAVARRVATELGWRVIVPDLRGFGASSAPVGPYPMATMAADALALLDGLGISRFALGGLSMGGYVAFALLRQAAARVRGLVLADTRAGADSAATQAAREELARAVEREGASAAVASQMPRLLRPQTLRDDAALTERVRGWITTNAPAGIAGAARGMARRSDASDLLGTIVCPTLILCGAADTTTPPDEAAILRDGIAGAELTLLPDAAHLSNLEQPALFTAALLRFCAALPAS